MGIKENAFFVLLEIPRKAFCRTSRRAKCAFFKLTPEISNIGPEADIYTSLSGKKSLEKFILVIALLFSQCPKAPLKSPNPYRFVQERTLRVGTRSGSTHSFIKIRRAVTLASLKSSKSIVSLHTIRGIGCWFTTPSLNG